jgi:hypothetical protein
MLVAASLGHASTRVVEKHYVSLFEGLDRGIAEGMDGLRETREASSLRLRPAGDVGPLWDRKGTVTPMGATHGSESAV